MPSPPTIIAIPLDARPVCYQLPQQLAHMAGVTLVMPPPNVLGHLKQPANINALYDWANTAYTQHPHAQWIVSLDTLVYGGLIPSRLGDEPKADLRQRWQQWLTWFKAHRICPHGIASVLRIPAYNNATEEPEYWATYGEQLHQLSIALHRDGMVDGRAINAIPTDVWQHFLATRARNMALHQDVIEALQQGQLASVVWGEDDTGPYGLNRLEAEQLETLLQRLELTTVGRRQTGADEVASTLLTRLLLSHTQCSPRIAVEYTYPQTAHHTAKFDGISFAQLAQQHIAACGATQTNTVCDADLVLLLHTPPPPTHSDTFTHGDWCEPNAANTYANPAALQQALKDALVYQKPLVIADVAAANGGDPALLAIINELTTIKDVYGYAGWNTPGNSVGSALALGVCRWWGHYNPQTFAQALLTRFIDDGLYQPHYRQTLPANNPYDGATAAALTQTMADSIHTWQRWCGLSETTVSLSFPCQRRFEIAVTID